MGHNRRCIVINGIVYKSIADACRDYRANPLGIHPSIISERLRKGWTIESAFSVPSYGNRVVRKSRNIPRDFIPIPNEIIDSMCANPWVNVYGLTRDIIISRLKRGWTLEKAFLTPLHR